jgi:hypothetical protein
VHGQARGAVVLRPTSVAPAGHHVAPVRPNRRTPQPGRSNCGAPLPRGASFELADHSPVATLPPVRGGRKGGTSPNRQNCARRHVTSGRVLAALAQSMPAWTAEQSSKRELRIDVGYALQQEGVQVAGNQSPQLAGNHSAANCSGKAATSSSSHDHDKSFTRDRGGAFRQGIRLRTTAATPPSTHSLSWLQHRIDQGGPASLYLCDGAPQRARNLNGLGNRPLGVPTAGLRKLGEIRLR